MSSSGITIERTIAAPPEKVFAASSSVHTWADVVPAITKVEVLTEGPVGKGTRFRETRTMFGRPATEEMEFLEFDPPRGYTLGAESHGCRYRTRFDVVPDGANTRLVMRFEAEPLTVFAKVMSVLMRPMMKKMADMCGKDLDAIKAHVESGG
ncbi:MAG: SRPBCC family protein [Planctomycetota bacterium]